MNSVLHAKPFDAQAIVVSFIHPAYLHCLFSYIIFFRVKANKPAEYFTDTAMRHSELPGNVTRSNALVSQLDDLRTNSLGQWTTVDKHTAKLVYAAQLYSRQQLIDLSRLDMTVLAFVLLAFQWTWQ